MNLDWVVPVVKLGSQGLMVNVVNKDQEVNLDNVEKVVKLEDQDKEEALAPLAHVVKLEALEHLANAENRV